MATKKSQTNSSESLTFEQYKLYVEIVNHLPERRAVMNQFYTTLLSSFFAVIMFALRGESVNISVNYLLLICSVVGVVLCYIWYQNIKTFAMQSKVKFGLLTELEKSFKFKFFTDEWKTLNASSSYKASTKLEARLPVIIGLLYILLLGYSIYSLVTILY